MLRLLYLSSVWLHIVAATVWLGGMAFLVLVVVPWLRQGERATAAQMLRDTGRRFRHVGWVCFGVLLVTGTFSLAMRGVTPGDFTNPDFRSSSFGKLVHWKLATFIGIVLLSLVHDFVIGPKATNAMRHDVNSAETRRLRKAASYMGRANVLLALAMVAMGVLIVRGLP